MGSSDEDARVVTLEVRFPRPVKRAKDRKPLRPRRAAPGEPRKYSTLSRGKPMQRGGRIKWKPARRIARETTAEKLHKKLIRQARVCAVAKYAGCGPCTGIFQVAHLGAGGMGQKRGDWTESTLMCADDPRTGRHGHHQDFDRRRGIFREMPEEERRAFCEMETFLAREFVAGRRMVSA